MKKHKKSNGENNIITIDGPAGSGKSTIAKILARDLGLKYINTGAMYRAITLLAMENNIDYKDEESILRLAKKAKLEIDCSAGDENKYTTVKLDGRDITEKIRSKEVGSAVSIVSKLSGIRKYLVRLQRKLSSGRYGAVLEGRDTGSVVCPNAVLKIFLTANLKERVKRRKLQIADNGQLAKQKLISDEIKSRDKIDSSRKDSPLIIPENAVVIDTSNMTIKEVTNKIKDIYKERINDKDKAR